MRQSLPPRRLSHTVKVKWTPLSEKDHNALVTYGCDDEGKIKEAFVASYRAESEIIAMTNDACILYSRSLQHGDTLEELARAMMQNTRTLETGEVQSRPASLIGAVALKALEVQREIDNDRQADYSDGRPGGGETSSK